MFPAATNGGGQCFAFPDVCKVPAGPSFVPVPFPNLAMLTQASKCAKKVKIANKKAVTVKSQIARTSGDEAGTLKGMISSTNMDKAVFKAGVSKVKVEGDDIVNHLKPTAHNGSNANAPAGVHVAPSQSKVLVFG